MRPNNNRRREPGYTGTVATDKGPKPLRWDPPKTMVEARTRRQETTDALMDVELKLSSRNLTDAQGRRLVGRQYWEFREALVRKKMMLVREIQYLKAFVSKLQEEESEDLAGVDGTDTEKLLMRAWMLLQQLKKEHVDFDDDELAFLDVLGKRVGKR